MLSFLQNAVISHQHAVSNRTCRCWLGLERDLGMPIARLGGLARSSLRGLAIWRPEVFVDGMDLVCRPIITIIRRHA